MDVFFSTWSARSWSQNSDLLGIPTPSDSQSCKLIVLNWEEKLGVGVVSRWAYSLISNKQIHCNSERISFAAWFALVYWSLWHCHTQCIFTLLSCLSLNCIATHHMFTQLKFSSSSRLFYKLKLTLSRDKNKCFNFQAKIDAQQGHKQVLRQHSCLPPLPCPHIPTLLPRCPYAITLLGTLYASATLQHCRRNNPQAAAACFRPMQPWWHKYYAYINTMPFTTLLPAQIAECLPVMA